MPKSAGARRTEAHGRHARQAARHGGGATPALAIAAAALLLALVGCAPKQRIPLEVGPGDVEVYVDGLRVAEPLPAELDLESDRAHVVFVKKPGHRSEQVVLRSVEFEDGRPQLQPDRVEVELRQETPRGRRLEVELDPPPSLPPGTVTSP